MEAQPAVMRRPCSHLPTSPNSVVRREMPLGLLGLPSALIVGAVVKNRPAKYLCTIHPDRPSRAFNRLPHAPQAALAATTPMLRPNRPSRSVAAPSHDFRAPPVGFLAREPS